MSADTPLVATANGRRCYHSRECYVVTRQRELFRPMSEVDVDTLELPECEICKHDGQNWGSKPGQTFACPECGKEVAKLGCHLPCDGVDDE